MKIKEESKNHAENPRKLCSVILTVFTITASLTIFAADSARAPVIFEDDMEPAEDPGWTHASVGGGGMDLWHVTTTDAWSPPNSWWCGNESTGNYDDADGDGTPGENPDDWLNDALFTPVLDLSIYDNVELRFMERYETEGGIYDQCWVELSTDDGSTWPTVLLDGTTRTGDSGGWQQTRLPLPKPFTSTMQIRFRFDTIDGRNNAYPGWFIDDVYIGSYKFIYNDQEKFGAPGTVINYTLTVNNSQTFADSFDLDYLSPSGWVYTFYEGDGTTPLVDTNGDAEGLPDTGVIPAQTSITIVVKVSIPPTATSPDVDLGTVNATSFNDPSFTDFVTLTTRVDDVPPDFGDPIIDPANPNATVDVNVTIPIIDESNITKARLWYSYDGVVWFDAIVTVTANPNATIPGPGFSTTVYYYVNATDECGNSNESSTFSYPAGSDLILTEENISYTPYPVEKGWKVTIEANVFNLYGPLNNVEVRFYLGDPDVDDDNMIDAGAVEIGTPSIINIGSSDSALASTTWFPPDIGVYRVYVWVDAVNASWEYNEFNNLASSTNIPVFYWVDTFDNLTKTESRLNITVLSGDAFIGTSSRYDFDFDTSDEGFIKEVDYLRSNVTWDESNQDVYIKSDRRDSGDELFTKTLPYTLTSECDSWTLTARWKNTVRGHWQGAFPIFITHASNDDPLSDTNSIFIRYASREKKSGSPPPNILLRYLAQDGTLYINENIDVSTNTEYHMFISYDSVSKNLTMEIRNVNDASLLSAWYVIGTNPGDNFTVGKIGCGSDGRSQSYETPNEDWTDDINFTIYTNHGNITSTPITLPPDGEWGVLYVNKTEPANTYINVTVIDTASGQAIPGFTNLTGDIIDLTELDPILYPSIKLYANFTSNETAYPTLHYWAVNCDTLLFSMPLYKGWNMISLPLNQSTTDLEAIFAGVDYIAVQCHNTSDNNNPWRLYHKDKGDLNDLSEVDKTMGIWIKMASNDILFLTGNPPDPTDIPLKKGWNYVGYPSLTPRVSGRDPGQAFETIYDYVDMVQYYNTSDALDHWKEWDPGSFSLDDLTEIVPGYGLWIHVTGDCTWIVDW
ncbi:MAG: hypothetical protein JSW28_10650 [Thermoplasmata archaeon]|nr:MAG: hypothetical protein JSW28_10650 [Thermoplasmata archaeon]